MMMKKILSTCSLPKVFLHYPLFGREASLLQRRTLHFLRENKLFIREMVFNLFANYFSWSSIVLGGTGPFSSIWKFSLVFL